MNNLIHLLHFRRTFSTATLCGFVRPCKTILQRCCNTWEREMQQQELGGEEHLATVQDILPAEDTQKVVDRSPRGWQICALRSPTTSPARQRRILYLIWVDTIEFILIMELCSERPKANLIQRIGFCQIIIIAIVFILHSTIGVGSEISMTKLHPGKDQ